MAKLISAFVHHLVQLRHKRAWTQQTASILNERPIEYAFVFSCIASTCPRNVLDVGVGATALPALIRTCGPSVTAIDEKGGYWVGDFENWHYYVLKHDILNPNHNLGTFDLVTCVSTLEHIEAFDQALIALSKLVAPAGALLLTFPYSAGEHIPNVYKVEGSSGGHVSHYRTASFSSEQVERWLTTASLRVERAEYWKCFSGAHWTVGERLHPARRIESSEHADLACLLMRKIQ